VGRALAGAPLVAALASLVHRLDAGRPARTVRVSADPRADLTLAAEVIVVGAPGAAPRVFSARCPHLGCRIARVDAGQLVCPCHGSRFRLDGSVVSGPASRPLTPLSHRLDPASGELIVDVG
jgi:Rieske Fe-S protein